MIFKVYSNKCHTICTVNGDVEAKSVNKKQRIETHEERKPDIHRL
jgi:hypothetical protein